MNFSQPSHAFATIGWLACSCIIQAQVPGTIHYQARIAEDGQALGGGVTMGLAFQLLAPTTEQILWRSYPVDVGDPTVGGGFAAENLITSSTSNGQVSVTLGSGGGVNLNEPIPLEPVFVEPESGAARAGVKLRVWMAVDGGELVKLEPDIEFASVPYAMVAGRAESVSPRSITAANLADGAITDSAVTGAFPVGRALVSSLPFEPGLQQQGYVRSEAPSLIGGETLYVYTRSAEQVQRFEIVTTSGEILVNGQTEPLDFGTVEELPSTITVTVRNIGNAALTGLDAAFDGIHTQDFSAALGSTELAPGATTSLSIEFLGAFGARSVLTVSATGIALPFQVPVTGSVPAPAGFAVIPAGPFTMGRTSGDTDSDAPPVNVTVSGFAMQTTEVTWDQWNEVRDWGIENGYTDIAAGGGKAGNHPVHSVSWWDVVKWCNARSEKENLTAVYSVGGNVMQTGTTPPEADWNVSGYRLPTEAEWEKAARGGVSGQRFPWGDEINHDHANYYANGNAYTYDTSPYTIFTYHPSYNDGIFPLTSPVGSFAPNGFGLYDMSGNVREWNWDRYSVSSYTQGASDPKSPASGSYRVIRGGGWYDYAINCRTADRDNYGPSDYSDNFIGVRIARSSVP